MNLSETCRDGDAWNNTRDPADHTPIRTFTSLLRPVHLHPSLIGEPLPWAVFTEAGVLVASAGMVVVDEAHFRKLVSRPLYREIESGEQLPLPPGINLLERLDTLAREAEALLTPPHSPLLADQLKELLRALLKTLQADPEACLGYLRRAMPARPGVHHALHVLVVAVLLSERLDYDEVQQFSLAGAALTMNLPLLAIQDRLHHYPGPLGEADRAAIASHPLDAAEMLLGGGVTDKDWLTAVAQHHENIDGSGYPRGLGIEAISPMARLLRVADVYCAKISGRHYRPPQSPRTAMKDIFGRERTQLDPQISAQLLRAMGLYPPGTLVRLANGEAACITRRGRGGLAHFATSFLDSRGRPMEIPRERPLDRAAFALRGFLEAEPEWPAINWKTLWGYA